jgi:hypothetical protein
MKIVHEVGREPSGWRHPQIAQITQILIRGPPAAHRQRRQCQLSSLTVSAGWARRQASHDQQST